MQSYHAFIYIDFIPTLQFLLFLIDRDESYRLWTIHEDFLTWPWLPVVLIRVFLSLAYFICVRKIISGFLYFSGLLFFFLSLDVDSFSDKRLLQSCFHFNALLSWWISGQIRIMCRERRQARVPLIRWFAEVQNLGVFKTQGSFPKMNRLVIKTFKAPLCILNRSMRVLEHTLTARFP